MANHDNGPSSLAVLTSGGDSPGMNAAVRAVVRTAVQRGIAVHAVYEGYKGLVEGGPAIQPMGFLDVGGILRKGGTDIGTARSRAFRTRNGRRAGVLNLVQRGIDGLVVIGGDGSLTGANIFRQDWPGLLEELVDAGELTAEQAAAHPQLQIVGLVGSIDNDMFGTDMTIGADSALHRITEAIDALHSTAASHQRAFVVEVMGRRCGYLALMAALATAANWVLIPEHPAVFGRWEDEMCAALDEGRKAGRRQSVVVVAEGATDSEGNPITSEYVREVLTHRMGEDTRVTILGHVQRGGSPSAFDRNMATLLGYAAVEHLRTADPDDEPQVIGIRGQQVITTPLDHAVQQTRSVAEMLDNLDFDGAMAMRGGSFARSWRTMQAMTRATARTPRPGDPHLRLGIMHSGSPAPGMNAAVRAALRLAMHKGHTVLGIDQGFRGLADGDVQEMGWMSVSGWVDQGGAELGTQREEPDPEDRAAIANTIAEHDIDALLVIGGYSAYRSFHGMFLARDRFPDLNIPIVLLPASIANNLPGSQLSVGADSALNAITHDVDRIKESAVASHRVFVVEVMGNDCGYLALLSGMAAGAERVYIPEEGITLADLQADVELMTKGFREGKRQGVIIRTDHADRDYTTSFITSLLAGEGGELFDARQAVLGHVQQGGSPSPFDRIQATRLATASVDYLTEHADKDGEASVFVGMQAGEVTFTPLRRFPELVEPRARRPKEQWWRALVPIVHLMAREP